MVAALVLAVAGVATVDAQPAAANTWYYPGPTISISQFASQFGTNILFVFWQGTGGGLWQAENDGNGWRGPYHLAQAGTMASEPTTATVGNNPYVVWQGTDNALWMTYFDGTRWIGACKLGMGPLGSRPSISRDESNVLTVGWKGTDGGLWYAYSPPNPGCGGWSGPHKVANTGTLGSSPGIAGRAGGRYLDAAWSGAGSSRDLWWHEGNGIFKDLGVHPIDSPPAVYQTVNVGFEEFWTALFVSGGHLWYARIHYGGPGHTTTADTVGELTNGGTPGSAPGYAFNPVGQTHYVVWKGTDNELWMATASFLTSWNVFKIPGMGPLG